MVEPMPTQQPYLQPPLPPQSQPVSSRWWLWTALAAGVVVLVVAGAFAGYQVGRANQQEEVTAARPTLPPSGSSAAAPTTASTTAGPSLNAHGNIEKALGQEARVTDADGNPLLTFSVDSITVDPACTSDYADAPENGHFIAVQMRLSTAPGVDLSDAGIFNINPNEFSYIGPDNLTISGSTIASFAAYECLDDADKMTSDELQPGSQYVGAIILDVPQSTGSLIYAPGSLGGGGWEWHF